MEEKTRKLRTEDIWMITQHTWERCLTNQVLVAGRKLRPSHQRMVTLKLVGSIRVKDWRRAGGGEGVGGHSRAGWGALGVEAAVSTAEVPCVAASRRLLTLSSSAFQPRLLPISTRTVRVFLYLLSGFVLSWVGWDSLYVVHACLDGSYRYAHQCQYLLLCFSWFF